VLLPQRLIRMYTFAAVPEEGFAGDIVLDMFCGTGATCAAAKATGRRYIGIDLSAAFCDFARERVDSGRGAMTSIHVPRVRVGSARKHLGQRALFAAT
jgi:DNA modification methylase